MTWIPRAATTALLLAALAWLPACTGGGDGPAAGGPEGAPSQGESPAPSPEAPGDEPRGTPACAEVRAGVDAFNAGDFPETVERFEAAVPLAQAQVRDAEGEGTARRAQLLLEAVEWYAALPPEDYPDASLTSPDFERYKQITLSQCVVGAPGDVQGDEDGGTLV